MNLLAQSLAMIMLLVATSAAPANVMPTGPDAHTGPLHMPSGKALFKLAETSQPGDAASALATFVTAMREAREVITTHRRNLAEADPTGAEMEAAVKAAELTVSTTKEALTGFLAEVQAVRDEINAFRPDGVTEKELEDFSAAAAVAANKLAVAGIDAQSIYKGMLSLTTVTITQLVSGLHGSDEDLKNAIQIAQAVFAASLEDASAKLEKLANKVSAVSSSFADISSRGQSIATTIESKIKDEAYLKKRCAALRGTSYGVCAGVCVLTGPFTVGASCIACYAIAAPITETEIADLKQTLSSARTEAEGIVGRFNDLSKQAGDLKTASLAKFTTMKDVGSELDSTATLITIEMPTWTLLARIWRTSVPQKLAQLKTSLENAIGK